MGIDLQALRLDLPPENLAAPEGVSRWWRRAALFLLAVFCAGTALQFFVITPAASGAGIPIRVQAASRLTTVKPQAFTAGGWVEPGWPHPTLVCAPVEGVIERLPISEGAKVEHGRVIVRLDARLYQAEADSAKARHARAELRVRALEARVRMLKAGSRPQELAMARAARDEVFARHDRLKAGYRAEDVARADALACEAAVIARQKELAAKRSRETVGAGGTTAEKAERDEAEYQAACRRHEAALAELARLRAGYLPAEIAEAAAELEHAVQYLALLEAGARTEEIEGAELELAAARAEAEAANAEFKAAQQKVAWCEIRSPLDGRVLEIMARRGTMLSGENRAILSVYDPEEMQVRVDVRQEHAADLHVGQKCLVKLAARKDAPYEGEVVRIDPLGNLARDTVRARVRLEDPDDHLRKDLTVTVDFLAREEAEPDPGQRPLVIPRSAVVMQGGKPHVFVIRAGRAHLKEIETGANVRDLVAVESGLLDGDLVAVSNLPLLGDGAPVRLETGP